MSKKRGPGRPSLGRSEHLEVMLTPEEKRRYENAARQYGVSLSDWVRINLTACSAGKRVDPNEPLFSLHGKNE